MAIIQRNYFGGPLRNVPALVAAQEHEPPRQCERIASFESSKRCGKLPTLKADLMKACILLPLVSLLFTGCDWHRVSGVVWEDIHSWKGLGHRWASAHGADGRRI